MNTARRKKFLKNISFKRELTHLIIVTVRKTPYCFLQTECNDFYQPYNLNFLLLSPPLLTIVLWMLPTQCSLNPSLCDGLETAAFQATSPAAANIDHCYQHSTLQAGTIGQRFLPSVRAHCSPLLILVTSIYSVSHVPHAKFQSLYSSGSQPP